MVTRRRKRMAAFASAVSLLLAAAEGSFHDGITGSSLRHNDMDSSNNDLDTNGAGKMRWSHQSHEERQSRNLQSLTGSTSAKESCEAAKAKEESDIAPGGGSSKCKCEQSVLDERYKDFLDMSNQPIVFELTCIDERCSYCSPDGLTCDRFSYGALFEEMQIQDGMAIKDVVAQVGYFETNQYIVGRPEAVVYTEFTIPSEPGSHACSMEIDGLRCAVCEYVDCIGTSSTRSGASDFYGLSVVCSNIMIGDGNGGYVHASDFETCDQAQIEVIGESQGVFEMYDPDYGQCYTAVEGCDRDKIELEQDGYYACVCLNGNLPSDGVSPFLENVKLECQKNSGADDNGNNICGGLSKDSIERTYSSYVTETNTRTIEVDGSVVIIEEFECETTQGSSDGCSMCRASIGEKECSECTMAACEGGISVPQIKCKDEDIDIDLCSAETATGTPFEAFSVCGLLEDKKLPVVLPPDGSDSMVISVNDSPPAISEMACNEKKNELDQRGSYIDTEVMVCQCVPIDENSDENTDSGTLLSCTTNGGGCGTANGGSVCNARYGGNDEIGLCFKEELVQGFLPDGSKTPLTRTTTYTHGMALGNGMVGRTLVLTEFENTCQLLVDGVTCQSCELQSCGETMGVRPLVDCTNMIDEQTFMLDTCDKFPSYNEGMLLRLTAGASEDKSNQDNDFRVCNKESADDQQQADQAVDASLPTTCQNAQPIVLPTQDISLETTSVNPNNNFALVSFVSSTVGVPQPSPGSLKSCTGDDDSPGLWYTLVGNGKGIHASVCREATNFEARISIYEGSCLNGGDSLTCVAGTAPIPEAITKTGPCNVQWLAKEGTAYYIRVHGSNPSETGNFNLFVENLDDEVTSSCMLDNEDGNNTDNNPLFDRACMSCAEAKTNKLRSSIEPGDSDCQCIPNPGTAGYHLTCVDTTCLKCNPLQDVCGYMTYELDIDQTGESIYGNYESFYFTTQTGGMQAGDIAAIQATECLELKDPYQQCMESKEKMMAEEDSEVFCECRGTSEEGDYMLLCSIYGSYEYCTSSSYSIGNDDDVCGGVLFGQSISRYGSVTTEFRKFSIEKEDNSKELITVEQNSKECFVEVNGEFCSKCDLIQCGNSAEEKKTDVFNAIASSTYSFSDMFVDCSNLSGGQDAAGTFECGSAAGVDGDNGNSLLSILAGSVSPSAAAIDMETTSQDQHTIPPDAFPPTLPPITKPTATPVAPPSIAQVANEIPTYQEDLTATEPPTSPEGLVAPAPGPVPIPVPASNATANEEPDEDITDVTENSSQTSPENSAAWGLSERRTVAYFASATAFAFVFL